MDIELDVLKPKEFEQVNQRRDNPEEYDDDGKYPCFFTIAQVKHCTPKEKRKQSKHNKPPHDLSAPSGEICETPGMLRIPLVPPLAKPRIACFGVRKPTPMKTLTYAMTGVVITILSVFGVSNSGRPIKTVISNLFHE
jgi:hypothetical protein